MACQMAHEGVLKECPICMDTKDDVELIPHMVMPNGDYSSHCMCGACRKNYQNNTCPFCNEVIKKEYLSDFMIKIFSSLSEGNHDPDYLAAIFEEWELFEMENEGKITTVKRVAKLLMEDSSFHSWLSLAVASRAEYLRDCAGVFFRIYAMHKDNEIELSKPVAATLDQVIEGILIPLENLITVPLNASFYGAVYQQALCAWLCAWRMGNKTDSICALVRRVGHAVMHCLDVMCLPNPGSRRSHIRRMGDFIHKGIISLSHVSVWGSIDADIVWNTLYA